MPFSPGLNVIFRGNQDPDAQAYFSTAGIASSALTPTAYDNASTFNGTNQYLSVADNSSIRLGGTNFTISAWFNAAGVTATQIILGKAHGSVPYDYELYIRNSRIEFDGLGGIAIVSNSTISPNQWYHVVIAYVSSTATASIYINGTLDKTQVINTIADSSTGFAIGAWANNTARFTGSIASCAIWKRLLSGSEIISLYNSGSGLTYAGAVSAGITSNIVAWWALNQTSVIADSAGSNTLTNNNSVTASVLGPIVTATASSRTLINNFVKGVKGLGLWNSMVCWPLRSSQNVGSGDTIRSLGGLGTYDGSRSSSGTMPAWGSTGMTFASASAQRIDITNGNSSVFSPQNTTWGAMAVSNQTSLPGGYGGVLGKNNVNDVLADIAWNLRDANTNFQPQVSNGSTQALFNVPSVGLNSFKSSVFSYDNANVTARVNGGNAVTSAYTPNVQNNSSQTLRIGCGPSGAAGNYFNGVISFALFGSIQPSQQVSLHSLYKTTLGQGLPLP